MRRAIAGAMAAAGREPADPGLRPTGEPGQYASNVAFACGEPPGPVAARIAAFLTGAPLGDASCIGARHIARAEVTGPGFITVTVPIEALTDLPERIAVAGPACVASDALRGLTVLVPPPGDPLALSSWEEARAALAAQLTASLAAAAGATLPLPCDDERSRGVVLAENDPELAEHDREAAAAVAFAGPDAVRFSLARALPGRPVLLDPLTIARHSPGNPAYSVRYAHARAASQLRWAAISRETSPCGVPRWPAGPISLPSIGSAGHRTGGYGGSPSREARSPSREATALLDALSWLPERVATAARRGRPDEFARYLEELASATIAALICPGDPGSSGAHGTDRLRLARAARTGLAAGLGLLGVSAPDRL